MQPALQLALLLAILLPASKIAASLCARLAIPPILGELLAGVVLGPGAINLLGLHLFEGGQATNSLVLLSQIGAILLMFMAGLETDVERMREASFTAFVVALSGVVWPFVLGAGVVHLLGLSWKTSLFIGGALTATSVSISARTLMDAGKMSSPEAAVILGAAVIDDVMGLFVLAFLAASNASAQVEHFGVAPMLTAWLQHRVPLAAAHPLTVQIALIAACVGAYFTAGYAAAVKWMSPIMLGLRKLGADEAVPSCVLGFIFLYAVGAEWLGSVAGITGAYLLGFVFANSDFKADIERSFYAMGHGLLVPLFFLSIGLTSDYRALSGHWVLLSAVMVVAVAGKLVGCGSAALVCGMDAVQSIRVGCGMVSRGEVGLIVTAMGASTGIFGRSEVAVMVAMVLLTTILTPLALRGAFHLISPRDMDMVIALQTMPAESEIAGKISEPARSRANTASGGV